MRDHLAHRYSDTAHAILQATVDEDLPELEQAVTALAESPQSKEATERSGQHRWNASAPARRFGCARLACSIGCPGGYRSGVPGGIRDGAGAGCRASSAAAF